MIPRQDLIDLRLRRDIVPSFDVHPFSLPAVRSLDVFPFHPSTFA